ncbi:unnamed protein product [Scytosiphon promiscuus]
MSRVVKFLGRTKAYFTECKQNMAPMPNPEWYEENAHARVTIKNLRRLPLSVHAEVWRSSLTWYKDSFEESFAWGRRRKEQAKRQEAEEKMDVLQGLVKDAREATHNSPEDLERSKVAIRELLEEIHENRDELKSVAQEKLDLIRLSLSEFSSGYREARDEEMKRVMAMDKSVLQSFLSERAGEVKRATSIISDAILDKDGPVGTTATTASNNSKGGGAPNDRKGEPKDFDGGGGDDDVGGGPRSFLSERTRQAIDGVLHDPDVERLSGRMKGFARGRLLQAESAARVLKGEEEGVAGGAGREGDADQRPRRRQRPGAEGEEREREEEGEGAPRMGSEGGSDDAGGRGGGGGGETPIISGLANEAGEFLAERVGQAKKGAKEVMAAASEVRRSRRTAAAAAAAERSAKVTSAGEDGGDSEQKEGSPAPDRGEGNKDPAAR